MQASYCPWAAASSKTARHSEVCLQDQSLNLGRPGRSGGTRTPNPRFWRPVLYPLSYTPRRRSAAFHMPFGVEQRKPSVTVNAPVVLTWTRASTTHRVRWPPALSGLRTRRYRARWIGAPCRPRADIKRGLEPNRAHGGDRMRSRIAAAAIDPHCGRPIRPEGGKTRAQLVVRLEFPIGDVVACSRVNGSGNMPGARFGRIARISRPRSRIQQSGLCREIGGLFGVNRRHASRCQNDVSSKRGARGDMI